MVVMSRARALVIAVAVGVLATSCSSQVKNSTTSGATRAADSSAAPVSAREREYFIAADEVKWNYAPLGRNAITGKAFDDVANTYVQAGPDRIGSTYTKCLYRGYTDASFKSRVVTAPQDDYVGSLGPVIRAQVGDTIKVIFRNNCSFPASIHPHGVFYKKDSEGAGYDDGTARADKADDSVPKGGTHVYNWQVPERAGPGPHDGSSVM